MAQTSVLVLDELVAAIKAGRHKEVIVGRSTTNKHIYEAKAQYRDRAITYSVYQSRLSGEMRGMVSVTVANNKALYSDAMFKIPSSLQLEMVGFNKRLESELKRLELTIKH